MIRKTFQLPRKGLLPSEMSQRLWQMTDVSVLCRKLLLIRVMDHKSRGWGGTRSVNLESWVTVWLSVLSGMRIFQLYQSGCQYVTGIYNPRVTFQLIRLIRTVSRTVTEGKSNLKKKVFNLSFLWTFATSSKRKPQMEKMSVVRWMLPLCCWISSHSPFWQEIYGRVDVCWYVDGIITSIIWQGRGQSHTSILFPERRALCLPPGHN